MKFKKLRRKIRISILICSIFAMCIIGIDVYAYTYTYASVTMSNTSGNSVHSSYLDIDSKDLNLYGNTNSMSYKNLIYIAQGKDKAYFATVRDMRTIYVSPGNDETVAINDTDAQVRICIKKGQTVNSNVTTVRYIGVGKIVN